MYIIKYSCRRNYRGCCGRSCVTALVSAGVGDIDYKAGELTGAAVGGAVGGLLSGGLCRDIVISAVTTVTKAISNDIILDSVSIVGKEIVRKKFGKFSPVTIVINSCLDIGNRELKNLMELSTQMR